MASPTHASRGPRWKGVATAPTATNGGSDLLQLLTLDLSPLEKRFEDVFARLDALEQASKATAEDSRPSEPVTQTATEATTLNSTSGVAERIEKGVLAKELEELHAAQLRLKVQHELAQAAANVEMETLRRDLLALPQHADLHNFRAEVNVLVTSTMKSLGDQQLLLWQDVERSLAARDLAENQWKAHFEGSMTERIQDVWAGLAHAQCRVDESLESLQRDMVKVEASTRETVANVDRMQLTLSQLETRTTHQEEETVAHEHAFLQLHALLKQTNSAMASEDAALQTALDSLKQQVDTAEQRHEAEQRNYETFIADTEKALAFCTHEITATIANALQRHQDKLQSLETGLTTAMAELGVCQDHGRKTDSRLGSLDGRLVQQEKQVSTLALIAQEQQHELLRHVSEIRKMLDQAAQDRVAIKRAATELRFTVQEVQQTLQEVGKMAATTELSLARAAAEIPKLHVLASTNTATISRTREALADLGELVQRETKFAHELHAQFENEVKASAARVAELHACDDSAQQSIAATNATLQSTKHALEEGIRTNGNMVHQLNAMVDALAITESATDMDDKLQRFALSTAELGLKLEHFSIAASTNAALSEHGRPVLVKDDVKAELAVLLAKVVRFLGSGVAIDQNKYFLSAPKLAAPSADPASGALVVESPAARVLEQLRAAKVALFCVTMRRLLDQLRPVAASARHVHESRDHFERQVRYVVEFGLANLFSNVGRPRHPNRKHAHAGTCIACDRPLDDGDDDVCAQNESHFARLLEATDPELEAVDELKMRRNKLVTNPHTVSSSSAGVTHKIDTRTAVKGRSGGPPLSSSQPRPRSAATENSSEYVYRAGFRLPRPSTAGSAMGKSASAAELAALHGLVVAAGAGSLAQGEVKATLDDTMSSCLERVALVGKPSQRAVDVHTPVAAPSTPQASTPSPLVRPHTAPMRSRSLPKLEASNEPAR